MGTDEGNISQTPPQEAAGGCWCDGEVMKHHRTGARGLSGEQHGASLLKGVWIKSFVGLNQFQRLKVHLVSAQLSSLGILQTCIGQFGPDQRGGQLIN